LANKNTIVEDYDVRSLRLFGSVARNEQKESSDVDVFVEMEPDIFQIIGLKEFLENLLGCSVDVVRKHRNNNEFLLKQIEKDGIDIIREPANRFAYA
jgi:predicted nucleotidyltransferase